MNCECGTSRSDAGAPPLATPAKLATSESSTFGATSGKKMPMSKILIAIFVLLRTVIINTIFTAFSITCSSPSFIVPPRTFFGGQDPSRCLSGVVDPFFPVSCP
jgi:hypothetical protein